MRSVLVGYLQRHHVALLALFIALGGTSYAATSGTNSSAGRLYACATDAYHTLNLTSAAAVCPAGQEKISWNRYGWSLYGNAGTTRGSYLGTRDDKPLNLDVNASRALELQPNPTSPNVIGGSHANAVASSEHGATIAGGGESDSANKVTGDFGTIGGGHGNTAAQGATVPGGFGNDAGGLGGTGAGATAFGQGNTANRDDATAFGGANRANALAATAFGARNVAKAVAATAFGYQNTAGHVAATAFGSDNVASGQSATAFGTRNTASDDNAIAFGNDSTAEGEDSLAAGAHARDPQGDDHTFIWADGSYTGHDFTASGANQFDVRATGGVTFQTNPGTQYGTGCRIAPRGGSWSCTSDRNAKRDFAPISDQQILRRLAGLLIDTWSYKTDPTGTRHIGPTAQDFKAAFKVGNDPRSIGLLDEGGVALAAIQGLYRQLLTQQAQIQSLQAQLTGIRTH